MKVLTIYLVVVDLGCSIAVSASCVGGLWSDSQLHFNSDVPIDIIIRGRAWNSLFQYKLTVVYHISLKGCNIELTIQSTVQVLDFKLSVAYYNVYISPKI